jgi:selT/selW/selH-like putative selenoprotein
VEAEIQADFPGAGVRLIAGSGGIFEVACNGRLVFSKKQTAGRRFPEPGEISRLLRQDPA